MPPPSTSGVTALLEQLVAGLAPTAVQLAGLSDLDREGVSALRESWPRVAPGLRESVVQRAAELAEDNVDLDFTQFARVALQDGAPAVRRRAAEALWESEDRLVARDLAATLDDDPDDSVRAAAAASLRHFVFLIEYGELDTETGEAVTAALRSRAQAPGEPVDVRANAVEALGARSLPWVEGVLVNAYYAEDSRLRIASVRAMGDSADDRYLDYLEEQATSDDPLFRFEAATAAGSIGSEEAVPFLTDLLADEDREVLIAAIRALGEVGGDEAVEALRALRPDDGEVAEALAEALGTTEDAARVGAE